MSSGKVDEELIGLSFGERRVRVVFNPRGDGNVNEIKAATAVLIDMLEEMKPEGDEEPEVRRLIELAQTAYEEAAMWAVKAVTA